MPRVGYIDRKVYQLKAGDVMGGTDERILHISPYGKGKHGVLLLNLRNNRQRSACWGSQTRVGIIDPEVYPSYRPWMREAVRLDEEGNPVVELATCGTCGRTWNDALSTSMTPAPSARCPFEYEHEEEA